jgi:hypothetical protein
MQQSMIKVEGMTGNRVIDGIYCAPFDPCCSRDQQTTANRKELMGLP